MPEVDRITDDERRCQPYMILRIERPPGILTQSQVFAA